MVSYFSTTKTNVRMEKENLNTKEAALFLCVSMSKLFKMCMRKELKYYKVGRISLFKKKDLEDYLQNHTYFSIQDLKHIADKKLANKKMVEQ